MARRRFSLTAWRAWHRRNRSDGDLWAEDDELADLFRHLLATRRGAVALIRAERRDAKQDRPQHTPHRGCDAAGLHAAYGHRKRTQR